MEANGSLEGKWTQSAPPRMKIEVLLRLLWLLMIVLAKKPDCSIWSTDIEVLYARNCTLHNKESKRLDMNHGVVDNVSSVARPVVLVKATTSLEPQVLPKNTCTHDLSGILLSVHNVTLKCCLEDISNETTRIAAHELGRFWHVLQSCEQLRGDIAQHPKQSESAKCDIKLFVPRALTKYLNYYPATMSPGPQSLCSVLLQNCTHNSTVSVLNSLDLNVLVFNGSLFNLVEGHAALSDTVMVLFNGCSFAEFKNYEFFSGTKT